MSPHSNPEQLIESLKNKVKDLENRIRQMMSDRHFPYGSSNANLYLALPRHPEPKNWQEKILSWLSVSSFFKLKPFGEPHDPMARNSLYFAQWLLAGIFIMELVGWALMFNEVLNAGVLKFSFLSIPAIFFGLIFAFGIIALEQAILTADVIDGWGKKKLALVIRIALIACSAAITTQPYELLFFSSEVKDRIHQESIRAEMVRQYHTYLELKGALVPIGASSTTPVTPEPIASPEATQQSGVLPGFGEAMRRCPEPGSITEPSLPPGEVQNDRSDASLVELRRNFFAHHRDDCDAAIQAIPEMLDTIDGQISNDTTGLTQVRRNISTATVGCDQSLSASESECVRQLRSLRASERGLAAGISKLQAEAASIRAAKVGLEINEKGYAARIPTTLGANTSAADIANLGGASATPETIRLRTNQLHVYMQKIITAKPGAAKLEAYRGESDGPFYDQEYGVTNKVRVLYSELSGSPYRWPNVDQKLKETIQGDFGLTDPQPGWTLYRIVPWAAVLLAAMFLPFVSLGYKLTLNENLNLYYVTEYQEQLGHVGATVATEAKRRFWELHAKKQKSTKRGSSAGNAEQPGPPRFNATDAEASQTSGGQDGDRRDGGDAAAPPFSSTEEGFTSSDYEYSAGPVDPQKAEFSNDEESREESDIHLDPEPDAEPWRGRAPWNSSLDSPLEHPIHPNGHANGSGGETGLLVPEEHISGENPEI